MQREYEVMGRVLQLHLGDITRLEVDAIVSSENSDLVMDHPDGASVSAAIRRIEGEAMARDVARLGPIEPGRAVLTPARNLPCRWVIHAAAVVKTEDGHHSSAAIVRESVRSALRLAAGLGLGSIAFPAFAVRAADVPAQLSCQTMVQELVSGLKEQTTLRRVVIALLDAESFLVFFEQAMLRATRATDPLQLRIDLDETRIEYWLDDRGPIARMAALELAPGAVDVLRGEVALLRSARERRLLDHAGELRTLGARVQQLIPPEVRERLAAEPGRPVLLRLDEGVAFVPFELAWDGERFLVERAHVARTLVTQQAAPLHLHPPHPTGRFEALLLPGRPRELPASAREAEAVLDLLWRRAGDRARLLLLGGRRATRRAVTDALARVELLHWCGHTGSRPDGLPSWDLPAGEELTPDDLRAVPSRARLVVANSCGPSDGVAFARAFLLAGARNYVGTLWDVDDELAQDFALHLYEELALGRSLGDALSAARAHLRKRDPIHWAAYLHYGDPRERLFEPVGLG